jgi:SAM-dependent methyltransferase
MSDHSHEHGHARHGHAGHDVDFDTPQMAADAALEAEVLEPMVSQATQRLADLCGQYGIEVRRVLDIGSGPGVGTCWLADQFDAARVVAVDGSTAMLEAATVRAQQRGLAPRVDTIQAELPAGFATLGRADVAWASMVLHHIGDETAALAQIRDLLEPGGLLAIVERATPMRVATSGAELGAPGIWERLDTAWDAWFADMRASLPAATVSAEYPAMLADAGLELVADEVLTLVLDAPLDARTSRFAHRHLTQMRAQLADHADATDLAALDLLIAEHSDESMLRADDLQLSATRHLYVARSPH